MPPAVPRRLPERSNQTNRKSDALLLRKARTPLLEAEKVPVLTDPSGRSNGPATGTGSPLTRPLAGSRARAIKVAPRR